MTRFTTRFLLSVAGILEKNLTHDGVTEPSSLVRMAACADLGPDISRIIGVYWLRRISRFRLLGCGQQKLPAFLRRGLVSPDLTHEVAQGRVGLVSGQR